MIWKQVVKNKFVLSFLGLVICPGLSLGWDSIGDTHIELTSRSIYLIETQIPTVCPDITRFKTTIVSGTGNSDFYKARKLEIAAHGSITLNGGNPSDIWFDKVLDAYSRFKFENAYYALGNLCHLTQDQAVPAHAANIRHGFYRLLPPGIHSDKLEDDASGRHVLNDVGGIAIVVGFV